ncbi:MAG: hypothetical protein ACK5H2_02990 [Beutenbergiaceae bacterium]
MRTRIRRPRLVTRVAAALALLAVLCGCAIPLPQVEADPEPEGPQPALDQARLDRVLAEIGAAVAAADEAQDPTLLEGRMGGAALRTRGAEYLLDQATAGTDAPRPPQALTTDPQVAVIGASDSWPKVIFVYTTIGEGLNTPLLLGLLQNDPRAEYKLVSWVRLLPEVTTPATAVPDEGSPVVSPTAEGLVLSPSESLTAYADLLTTGQASSYYGTFDPDVFSELVWQNNSATRTGVEDAGSYTDTFTAFDTPPISLGTAEGGAIVMGNISSVQAYVRSIEDSELTVGGQVAALAGTDEIDVQNSVTANYYTTVALYVPPAADGATIQVLGAERVLLDVTTS